VRTHMGRVTKTCTGNESTAAFPAVSTKQRTHNTTVNCLLPSGRRVQQTLSTASTRVPWQDQVRGRSRRCAVARQVETLSGVGAQRPVLPLLSTGRQCVQGGQTGAGAHQTPSCAGKEGPRWGASARLGEEGMPMLLAQPASEQQQLWAFRQTHPLAEQGEYNECRYAREKDHQQFVWHGRRLLPTPNEPTKNITK